MTTTIQAESLRASVYTAILYGYGGPSPGEDWGIDLGRPTRYTRHGTVYRQQFEHGITLANIGDTPARVDLDAPCWDLDGVRRTVINLPPHSADILALELPRPGGSRDRTSPPFRVEELGRQNLQPPISDGREPNDPACRATAAVGLHSDEVPPRQAVAEPARTRTAAGEPAAPRQARSRSTPPSAPATRGSQPGMGACAGRGRPRIPSGPG